MSSRTLPATFRTPGGERLRVIRRGPLGAVIGHAGPRTRSPANLRRYERAVRFVAARCPAILPARFGTCLGRRELDLILVTRRAALARALARVRGRAQVTIRILGLRPDGPRDGDDEPARAVAVSGRDYLQIRARRRARGRDIPEFAPVRAAVTRWIRDERVERQPQVSTVYHLIPRAAFDRYRTVLQRAAAVTGLHVIVSGPWPPYAFAEDVG